jgi:CBS domain-containing protein
MHPGVLTCPPDTSLSGVARIMAEHRVHCVVVEEPGAPTADAWSVVSGIDLVAAAAADRLDEPVAGQVAATSVPRVGSGDPLTRVAQIMSEHAVQHVVVVDDATGRPAGILSSLDLAAVLTAGDR